MEWLQARDGGFYVRSDKGNWSYAYPTSPRAHDAIKHPDPNAKCMAMRADAESRFCPKHIIEHHNEHLAMSYEAEYAAIHSELDREARLDAKGDAA